jgi:hypothetical protein
MSRPSAYSKLEFWKAYTQLYWCSSDNTELVEAARTILSQVNSGSEDEPLRVLVLGIGAGTFELPLLSQLARSSGRELRLVGIDGATQPLHLVKRLLERGWEDLPVDAESVVHHIEELAGGDPGELQVEPEIHANCPYRLFQDDLDFDSGRPGADDYHAVTAGAPSKWRERLLQRLEVEPRAAGSLVPGGKFDVIIASFSLFHLTWWRWTLIQALSLLDEGGIFLHSTVGGDEHYLEGRTTTGQREPRTEIIRTVFTDTFFTDRLVQQYLRKPRAVSAARPFAIDDMLERLAPYGLKRLCKNSEASQVPAGYEVVNEVGFVTYKALLDTRGFSTFREAGHEVGDSHYELLVSKATESYSHLEERVTRERGDILSDRLAFHLEWTVLRRESGATFFEIPPASKFWHQERAHDSRSEFTALQWDAICATHAREYELSETKSDTVTATYKNRAELADLVARHLITGGLLRKDCLGGEVGLVVGDDAPAEYFCFTNFLNQASSKTRSRSDIWRLFANRLSLYLLALRFERPTNYSNARVLLKTLMPKAGVPCIFSYCIDRGHSVEPTIELSLHSHRGFFEVRFHIHGRYRIIEHMISKAEHEGFWEEMGRRLNASEDTTSVGPALTYLPARPEFEDLWASISEPSVIVDIRSRAPAIAESLVRRVESLKGFPPATVQAVADALSSEMVQTLLWLYLFQGPDFSSEGKGASLIMFPATYYIDEKPTADNAVLMFYTSPIRDRVGEVEHEYQKINSLYDRAGLNQAYEVGRQRMLEGASHELSKLTKALTSSYLRPLGELFEISGVERNVKPDDQWYEPAGHIITSPGGEHAVSRWLVSPVPSLIAALRNLLFMWSGVRGWRNDIGLAAELPFAQAIQVLIDVARTTAAGAQLLDALPAAPEKVHRATLIETGFQEVLSALPRHRVRMDTGVKELIWFGMVPQTNQAHSSFMRLFVAALANAFAHSPANHVIEIDLSYVYGDFLMLRVFNQPTELTPMARSGKRGTKDVLELCLSDLGAQGTVLFFGIIDDASLVNPNARVYAGMSGYWLTELRVPITDRREVSWVGRAESQSEAEK